jgi:hypothetical protein
MFIIRCIKARIRMHILKIRDFVELLINGRQEFDEIDDIILGDENFPEDG